MIKPTIISFLLCIVITGSTTSSSMSYQSRIECCSRWQAEVDSTVDLAEPVEDIESLQEKEIIEGIECLLSEEGNKNKARFGGATNGKVSAVPPPTTAEIASLYFISYLYYQKFDHASMVALINESTGKYNQPEDVAEAYASYRKWFEEVKKIGLAKARKQKLDPLAHTKVKWY